MKTNGHTKPKIVSLRNLSDHSTQIRSAVGVDDPLFQSFPSEVFFHDFEAFSVHEATITLRNKDLVGRRVQLEPPASHFFSLSAPQRGHNARNKVAPGMEVLYTLTFKPESSGDYHCDIICTTEREQFVIPVRARGDRAKLDYPSRIEFPCAPVKFPSTHPFLLRNYGPRATSFSLTPPTGYTVSPSEGFIEVGDCINVALVFTPVCEGRFAGELWINLDDGVRMSALVSGEGKNVDVKLEASQLECLSTYIQLSSVKTVLLFNHSEIPIQFSWRNNKTEQEEIQLKQQLRVRRCAGKTI
jgi:hydrocephalus-inducing protein